MAHGPKNYGPNLRGSKDEIINVGKLNVNTFG